MNIRAEIAALKRMQGGSLAGMIIDDRFTASVTHNGRLTALVWPCRDDPQGLDDFEVRHWELDAPGNRAGWRELYRVLRALGAGRVVVIDGVSLQIEGV